ncbi:glucosamine-6-phosphate deaminase [Streptococcus dentasini]
MNIKIVASQEDGAQYALGLVKEKLAQGARVLGLATGSSPEAFYKALAASDLDLSQVTSINLDEYVGLAPEDPRSYHYFMKDQLFDHKNVKEHFLPDGQAENLEAAAADYEDLIADHGIDIQILGIGRNGHIGFNEPGTPFNSRTHVVDLTPSTIEANSRFFARPEDVPTQAVSMGIASIMSAKSIILFAYSQDKAEAVSQMINGPVTEALPASVLQEHPDVTVILDQEAACKL